MQHVYYCFILIVLQPNDIDKNCRCDIFVNFCHFSFPQKLTSLDVRTRKTLPAWLKFTSNLFYLNFIIIFYLYKKYNGSKLVRVQDQQGSKSIYGDPKKTIEHKTQPRYV